jgi:hypothetical protein
MKVVQMWQGWRQRFRDWRTVNAYSKSDLSLGEIFYRLAWWQRTLLVIGCLAIIYKFQAPVFAMNVGPHIAKLWNADGTFNHAEWSIVENQSAGVFTLAIGALLIGLPKLNIVQRALIIPAMLMAFWMNASNGTETQTMAHDARNSTTIKHNARIDILTQQVADNTAAWQAATKPPKRTTQAMVDFVAKGERDLEKRAHDECNQGTFGYTRGPKCGSLEAQHGTKLEELSRIQADKDATDFLVGIEAAISADKAELKELGPKVEHADSLSVWTDFLASLHVLTAEQAKTLTEFKPVTDTIGAEAFASCMTIPSLIGWVWLWGLFTCHRGEAERRMIENSQAVAEELAKATAAVVQQAAIVQPETSRAAERVDEPDHSEAAVLGIDGDELPRFAEAPQTVMEHMAAAHLKADPERNFDRKARRKIAHEDSVSLWRKERVTARDGRGMWQADLYVDYVRWCDDMNLIPLEQAPFGTLLRAMDGIRAEFMPSRRYKYIDVGLRPNLRVVAA